METVSLHLSISKEAADLLGKYASKRTRGAFISDLIVAHDVGKKGGDGILDTLRKQAAAAQAEASRLTNVYNKAKELYQPQVLSGNGNGKKR